MQIKYLPTGLDGVTIIEPGYAEDNRGWFSQLAVMADFRERVAPVEFLLENESFSRYGVVRGLHYQLPPYAQGKLVRAVTGRILDVAVDVRRGSPTYGQYISVELSEANRRMLYVPRGFAHGFSVLSQNARVCYKCDNIYAPEAEVGIKFDDPAIGIDWQIPVEKIITSAKDAAAPPLAEAEAFDYGQRLY